MGSSRIGRVALLALLALLPSLGARAQVVIKPRVMVLIDTSGSMIWHFDSDNICGGDGDKFSTYRDGMIGPNNWYPGIDGNKSRIYGAKKALTDVINATGDIDFGLERYGLNEMCADKKNCCTFGNPLCYQTPQFTQYIDAPITFNGGCGVVVGGVPVDGGQILTTPAQPKSQYSVGGNLATLQWVDGVEDFRDRGDGWPLNGELRAQGSTPLAGSARTALNGWYSPIYDVSKVGSPKYNPNDPLFDAQFDCRPYVWIAMTDGADTCDPDAINGPPQAVTDLYNKNPQNPIKTYVIGLAFKQGDPAIGVLNNMAQNGGSTAARFANSQTDIEAAFADIAAASIKVEFCNGKDDNCNGLIDEGFDKGAKCTVGVGACVRTGMKKCDPNNNTQVTCCVDDGLPGGACAVLMPGPPMKEICNGIDDDCNGIIDDPPVCQIQQCFPEICNGKDDDCDGVIDNNLVDIGRPCGYSIGICRQGTTTCLNMLSADVGMGAPPDAMDYLACAGGVSPQPEACNGLDDDCDGIVDGMSQACYDGPQGTDNVAGCHDGLQKCNARAGSGQASWGACLGESVPQAETCNGLDDDCDGRIDDVAGSGNACCPSGQCGVGLCVAGTLQCSGGNLACVGGQGPVPEQCNGLDDDCNGTIDDLPSLGLPCQPLGGGCVGRLACDLNARQEVCTPGSPSPEICNGLDDNCDGFVDEEPAIDQNDPRLNIPCGPGNGLPLPCGAGKTTCNGGRVVCSGGQGPTTEVCDCLDNDCNGTIDDGALCPGGTQCVNCGCYAPCALGEFPCPGGYDCVDGFCLPHSNCDPPCHDGFVCIGQTCIDRCMGVSCPATYRCDHGSCVDNSCVTHNSCAACDGTAGQRCDAATRACVPDLCCGKQCDTTNQFCEPGTGGCTQTCIGKSCPGGQICLEGQCAADLCAGKSCGELQICDPKTGMCVANICGSVTCVPGFVCCGGMCKQDLCELITCPRNYRCTTNPIDCSHSCDTIIVPESQQDKVVGAGGGGLALTCAMAPVGARSAGGGAMAWMIAMGITIAWRRRRR